MWREMLQNHIKLFASKKKSKWFFRGLFTEESETVRHNCISETTIELST